MLNFSLNVTKQAKAGGFSTLYWPKEVFIKYNDVFCCSYKHIKNNS